MTRKHYALFSIFFLACIAVLTTLAASHYMGFGDTLSPTTPAIAATPSTTAAATR